MALQKAEKSAVQEKILAQRIFCCVCFESAVNLDSVFSEISAKRQNRPEDTG